MGYRAEDVIERLYAEKKAMDAYFTSVIQDSAGSTSVRRIPMVKPDWPDRRDYANRHQFRAACAQWRKDHP